MTKIIKVIAQHAGAIEKLISFDFKGCTCIVTGANDSGKSTILKRIAERIQNNTKVSILRKGEKEGFIQWDLSDGCTIKLRNYLTRNKTELIERPSYDGNEIDYQILTGEDE